MERMGWATWKVKRFNQQKTL